MAYRSGRHGPVNRGPTPRKSSPKIRGTVAGLPRLSCILHFLLPVPGVDHMSTASKDADGWFFVSRDGPVSVVLPGCAKTRRDSNKPVDCLPSGLIPRNFSLLGSENDWSSGLVSAYDAYLLLFFFFFFN